jgi:hypothetical protein
MNFVNFVKHGENSISNLPVNKAKDTLSLLILEESELSIFMRMIWLLKVEVLNNNCTIKISHLPLVKVVKVGEFVHLGRKLNQRREE